jgi:hypothetical protein
MAGTAITQPVHRLIPSSFPPIATFAACASLGDLDAVMELEGWTNDRIVAARIKRLPRAQWVYGEPCASIVMASFLHARAGRFNEGDLGAWYASSGLEAAVAAVAHHALGEIMGRGAARGVRVYREYLSELDGCYEDLRDDPSRPELDPNDHRAGQLWGAKARAAAYTAAGPHGFVYPAIRYADPGQWNVVALAPRQIVRCRQSRHFELHLEVGAPVRVRLLSA